MKRVKAIGMAILTVILALGLLSACGGNDEVTYYPYSPGETFTTNIKNSKKLVSCNITIETTNKKDVDKLFVEKNYIIRDTILAVLRDQDEKALEQHDIQSTLSELMSARLNETLGIDTIYKIYFEGLVSN